MAKPNKPQQKTEPLLPKPPTSEVSESAVGELPATETTDKPSANTLPLSNPKKDMAPSRPKKPNSPSPKGTSLLPSAYKLEHLKAAVDAAGSTEKLLLILHHVEEAGGKADVSENIETYRVLKTVLEESSSTKVDV